MLVKFPRVSGNVPREFRPRGSLRDSSTRLNCKLASQQLECTAKRIEARKCGIEIALAGCYTRGPNGGNRALETTHAAGRCASYRRRGWFR